MQTGQLGVSLNIDVDYHSPLPGLKECLITAQVLPRQILSRFWPRKQCFKLGWRLWTSETLSVMSRANSIMFTKMRLLLVSTIHRAKTALRQRKHVECHDQRNPWQVVKVGRTIASCNVEIRQNDTKTLVATGRHLKFLSGKPEQSVNNVAPAARARL